MRPRQSIYVRRLALATLFAGAATLSASAFGDPVVAYAAPKEWDIGYYDACVARALADYQGGKSTFQDYHGDVAFCCIASGGELKHEAAGADCMAPAGEQAQEAERQPAPPAGDANPWPEATLWMPMPPPGRPAAPPPGQATLAP